MRERIRARLAGAVLRGAARAAGRAARRNMDMLRKLLGEEPVRPVVDARARDDAATAFIDRCGYAAAALTLLPLPATEIVAVMPLHVAMVAGLAELYGKPVTRESAARLVLKIGATAGMSFVGTRLATTAAKLILPGFGGVLGAPLVFASTAALGAVACRWLERDGELTTADLRAAYSDAVRRAKTRFDLARAKGDLAKTDAEAAASEPPVAVEETASKDAPSAPPDAAEQPAPAAGVRARLEEAKALFDAGLIDEAQLAATRERILAAL